MKPVEESWMLTFELKEEFVFVVIGIISEYVPTFTDFLPAYDNGYLQ